MAVKTNYIAQGIDFIHFCFYIPLPHNLIPNLPLASPLLLISSLFAGIAYALLLYSKKHHWSQQTNILFALIRLILVALVVFIILTPFVRQKTTHIEKPVVVIAVDNSKSMALGASEAELKKVLADVKNVANTLQDNGLKVQVVNFDKVLPLDSLDRIPMSARKTDLHTLLNDIQNNNENINVNAVIMISDGIYNAGSSPVYSQYKFNLFTIGTGDTLPKKDLILKNVSYNNIVSAGNKFPLVAEIKNTGFKGKPVNIILKKGSETIGTKTMIPASEEGLSTVEFISSEENKGLKHYTMEITPSGGEFSTKNNIVHIYFDVIEARQKILMVAAAPHPDLKALQSVVDHNTNIEALTYIPGINEFKDEKYDLVIFHQVPNIFGIGHDLLTKFSKNGTPVFFVLGNLSNINELNIILQGVRIMASSGQYDKVTPDFNPSFQKFTFDAEKTGTLREYPPLMVPFGEYNISNDWESILFQKVGAYSTSKPLLAININKASNTALLAGEGIWQWRMNELGETEKTQAFDDFFYKLFQLLATKEDKSRFKVKPLEKEFGENEKINFRVEMYNDIFEQVYDKTVALSLLSESGKRFKYNFVHRQESPLFEISGLPEGLYKYEAQTSVGVKNEIVKGEFSVKSIDLEGINTTADFNTLRLLAEKNNGKFYTSVQPEILEKDIKDLNAKNLIYTSESLSEVINIRWLFFILLFLASFEWVLRKYSGSY